MNLQITQTTTISSANQLPVPSQIRKAAQLKTGDKMSWSYNLSTGKIELLPLPQKWGTYLYGIGRDLSDGTDATERVKQLRKDRILS
jgi:bifunctional DNA-binding transcriptional regulator/antitoxin component of YhaV-PrlF toxin-antitoxin module